MWNRNEQTICAISTPQGVGGIAVIRISGKEALAACKRLAKSLSPLKKIVPRHAYLSEIFTVIDPGSDYKIDDVLITYFAEGRSFTGEEVVEISCHGSQFITQKILESLIQSGCRMANKGEFTFRAFMNGKLDLVQAESVLALIESQSQASAKIALRQLAGHVSKQFAEQISELTWCLAHIEASIDFSEQGIEVVNNNDLIKKLKNVMLNLQKIIASYKSGKIIKEGIKVALIGEPNVGKSSLLNLLLQQDRAIVTPIAGTTRDAIEGDTVFEGIKFSICDTAGLRETQDLIESIGISKSKFEASTADIVCFVLDCSEKNWTNSLMLAAEQNKTKQIFLLNKADTIEAAQRAELIKKIDSRNTLLFTSALQPETRRAVLLLIKASVGNLEYLNEAIISSARQHEQASYSLEMIANSVQELEQNIGAEFVALHLKEALVSLQKILGQVFDDQILDRIFKDFCLGK